MVKTRAVAALLVLVLAGSRVSVQGRAESPGNERTATTPAGAARAGANGLKGDSVAFAKLPTATKLGGKTRISFAVAGPTDVEVAILDASGNILRSLAAGVLGATAPPPEPLQAGLSQELDWDGLDDFGKQVAAARIRVRLGTRVKFGRMIGQNAYATGGVTGVAADTDGNVYLLSTSAGTGQFKQVTALDAALNYVRTVLPFPADLPADRIKDWAWHDGVPHPWNRQAMGPEFYLPAPGDGFTPLTLLSQCDAKGLLFSDGDHLFRIARDGGMVDGRFNHATFWNKKRLDNTGLGPAFLTASPDGKYLYLSGPFSARDNYGRGGDPDFPPGQIYRLEIGEGPMAPFAKTETHGAAWAAWPGGAHGWGNKHTAKPGHFTTPHGPVHQVAVDASGNVLVADRDNQCVQVYDPAGKPVGKLDVPYPDLVCVDPKDDTLYVLTLETIDMGEGNYPAMQRSLLKYASWKSPKPQAVLDFGKMAGGGGGGGAALRMALASATTKSLFITGLPNGPVRVTDAGNAFERVDVDLKAKAAGALANADRIEVDYDTDTVYINDAWATFRRFEGETGKEMPPATFEGGVGASQLTVGDDGFIYAQLPMNGSVPWSGPLKRYTRDLQPAPYAKTGTHELAKTIYGRMHYDGGLSQKGITAGRDGKVYLLWMSGGWNKYGVTGFDAEGTALQGEYLAGARIHQGDGTLGHPVGSTVITVSSAACGAVRTDSHGNIYVGIGGLPKDSPRPPGFEHDGAYPLILGTVVKFGPQGGKMTAEGPPAGTPSIELPRAHCVGGLRAYPGFGPLSSWRSDSSSLGMACACRNGRFDIDRFDRLYIPNPVANTVQIVDNAGNVITAFGSYGNFDSQGPGSAIPRPEIPLGWPVGVGVSAKHVYVSDMLNRRVVRADLVYSAEGTVDVP